MGRSCARSTASGATRAAISTACSLAPGPRARAASSNTSGCNPATGRSLPRPPGNRRVGEAQLASLGEGDDLLEAFAEIQLERLPFGPAQMRRAEDVRHLQQRMVAAGDRLLLV